MLPDWELRRAVRSCKNCCNDFTRSCRQASKCFISLAFSHPDPPDMPLSPNLTEILARARADLRMGVPVALRGAHRNIEWLGPGDTA